MTTTPSHAHRRHPWAPESRWGRWTISLAALALAGTASLAVALAAGLEPGDTFSDNWLVTGAGAVILVSAAASVVAGGVARTRYDDRGRSVLVGSVVGVLLVVAGCSSGDEADDADAPSPSSAVTREPSVPDSPEPASPDLAQVCALVTPGELEAIVGAPVTDGVVQDSGWGSPECRFESLDGVPANGSVTVAVAPGVRDGVELFPTPLVSSFHVGGHEADWHQETGLLVVVADQQPPWLLHAVVRLEHRNREAESIDLAELVVSRLPLLLDGRRVCRLFRADDFEDVFGARTTARPPRVFTSPMSLGDCVFPSRSGAGRLELGAYVARVPGGPAIAPVESLSRRVTGLGPRTFWHPRSGVSVDLAGQGVVWLRVAATRNTGRPDRSLSIAAARIVLERLDAPATPPG